MPPPVNSRSRGNRLPERGRSSVEQKGASSAAAKPPEMSVTDDRGSPRGGNRPQNGQKKPRRLPEGVLPASLLRSSAVTESPTHGQDAANDSGTTTPAPPAIAAAVRIPDSCSLLRALRRRSWAGPTVRRAV